MNWLNDPNGDGIDPKDICGVYTCSTKVCDPHGQCVAHGCLRCLLDTDMCHWYWG